MVAEEWAGLAGTPFHAHGCRLRKRMLPKKHVEVYSGEREEVTETLISPNAGFKRMCKLWDPRLQARTSLRRQHL